MVKVVKDFINYLFEIVCSIFITIQGIVGVKTIKDFIEIYNKKYPQYENLETVDEYLIRELLSLTLIEYLSKLTENDRKGLSMDIIAKFAENKSLERIKKAKALFIIYSKIRNRNNTNLLNGKFYKWKKIYPVDLISNISKNSFNKMSNKSNFALSTSNVKNLSKFE